MLLLTLWNSLVGFSHDTNITFFMQVILLTNKLISLLDKRDVISILLREVQDMTLPSRQAFELDLALRLCYGTSRAP